MESYRRAGDSIGVSTAQVFYITAHMRREGDFQPLIPYIDEAIAVSESVGSLAAMWLLRWQLGYAALVAGDVETAERECRVGLQIQRRLGHEPWAFVFAIFVLACTADLRGNFVAAARLRGATATMADQLPPGRVTVDQRRIRLAGEDGGEPRERVGGANVRTRKSGGKCACF